MRHKKSSLPLATKSAQGRSIPLTAETLVNMYAEQAPGGSRSGVIAVGCPGILGFADISAGFVRGVHWVPGEGTLWVVVGLVLYKISEAGTATNIGAIGGYGRVSMADNGTELVITTEAITYIVTLATNTLAAVTDSDFPNADTVAFLGGYFFFNNNQTGSAGQLFWSEIYGGSTYDALDFATAENVPDNLVAVWRDHDRLLLFGDRSIESWFLTGGTEIVAPYKGSVINRGLGARWSIANVDNSVIFLDENGIVRRIGGQGGYNAERISTHAIEYRIEKGAWRHDDGIAYDGAVASSYIEEGHEFYVLTVPGTGTFVYDAATSLWHERKSRDLEHYRASFHVLAFNKNICGDTETGKLYEQNLRYNSENGDHLVAEVQFPQVSSNGDRFRVHELQLHIENIDDSRIYQHQAAFTSSLSWVERTTPFGGSWAYKIKHVFDQTWVAIANNDKMAYSTDGGVTWALSSGIFGGAGYFLTEITYSAVTEEYLICSSAPLGRMFKTKDFVTWTDVSSAKSDPIFGLATDGNIWVNAGKLGRLEYTYSLGSGWTQATNPVGPEWAMSVVYDNGVWLVPIADYPAVLRSNNGIDWTEISLSSIIDSDWGCEKPSFGNGTWVMPINNPLAESPGDGGIAISTDNGLTWSFVSDPLEDKYHYSSFYNGVFLVVGNNNSAAFSNDGLTWTVIDIGFLSTQDITGTSAGGGSYAVSGEGGRIFMVSPSISDDVLVVSEDRDTIYITLDVLSDGAREPDTTQVKRLLGLEGEHDKRVIFRRLGQHRSFTPRFTLSASAKRLIFDATARISWDG